MSPKQLSVLQRKIEKAMREAIHQLVEEHKKTKIPLAVWKNGKVINISAKNVKLG